MTSLSQNGFTLIELIVVIVVLGIVAALAVPRFVGLPDDVHRAQVNATAGSMRASVNLIKGKARTSEIDGTCYGYSSFEYSYGGEKGKVGMNPDLSGAPVRTCGYLGSGTTASEELWDLLVRTPPIKDRSHDPKETGWYSNKADAFGNSWVYGWEYWVNDQLFARIIYNATEKAGGTVDIDWDPDEF